MGEKETTKQKGAFGAKVKQLALTGKSMWKKPLEGRYLTLKEMCSFGMFALGNSWLMNAVNYVATVQFIPYFYDVTTIHAYIIVALATFINMLCLPFIGNKIEKTNTKIGKYKPFILGCLPIYVIFAMLAMWIPQYESEASRIIYVYLTCTPVLVLSTFCNNMYQNMPTVITPNTQERADIMTPIGLLVGFAPSVMQLIVGPIRMAFPDKEYLAMRILGAVSVVISVVLMLFILKVKERVYNIQKEAVEKAQADGVEVPKEEKLSFFSSMKMLGKNKPLIIFCIALILGSMRDFTGQFRWLVLQIRTNINPVTAIQISGLPQTIIGFAATVSMFLLPLVTRKMNKRAIVVLFGLISALPNLILAIVRYQNIPMGTVSLVLLTILYFVSCINPLYLLIPIMLGEIADYQQYLTGKRLDGHMQNLIFVVPTLVFNVLMLCSYFLQKNIGFEPSDYANPVAPYTFQQQTIACQWFNILSLLSAVSGILLVVVMLLYPLSKSKHLAAVEALTAKSVITNAEDQQNGGSIADEKADAAQETTEEISVEDSTSEDENSACKTPPEDIPIEEADKAVEGNDVPIAETAEDTPADDAKETSAEE